MSTRFRLQVKDLAGDMMRALGHHASAAQAAAHPAKFLEHVGCQVKMLTFLTFLLRGLNQDDPGFKAILSDCIRHILRSLPPNAVSVRCMRGWAATRTVP